MLKRLLCLMAVLPLLSACSSHTDEILAANETVLSSGALSASSAAEPAAESRQEASAPSESAAGDASSSTNAAASSSSGAPASGEESTAQSQLTDSKEPAPDGKILSYNLDSTRFLTQIENEFIDILNENRVQKGLNELERDKDLSKAARLRAIELSKNDYFAHERPDGSPWFSVLETDVPTSFKRKGENLASVYYIGDTIKHQSAQDWFAQWEASPTHYDIMFHQDFTSVGVGIYYTYDGGKYTAVAASLFGGDG